MALTPITRKEQFYARIAGDAGQELTPITRTEHFLQRIIEAGGGGGGGGAVSSVNGKTGAVTLTAADVGAAAAETVVEVTGTTPTITPAANTAYKCGELTSLTIDSPPATGKYSINFVSGATPTATIIPPKPAMRWQTDDNEPPQGFPAANTRYEINVDDTYVVLGEWPVPEVSA